MPLRLILIEDQHLFRESLAASIATRMEVEIVGAFTDTQSPLGHLPLLATADLALVDIKLGDGEAFELVAALQSLVPKLRLVWCTSVDEDFLLQKALDAHLPGFIHKADSLDVLVTALQTVAGGRSYISESVQTLRRNLKTKTDSFFRILSPREQEVLRLIGTGFSNEEAAAFLGLSAGTVQAHRRNIMGRLDIHSAAELQAYAVRHGFANPGALKLPSRPRQ